MNACSIKETLKIATRHYVAFTRQKMSNSRTACCPTSYCKGSFLPGPCWAEHA